MGDDKAGDLVVTRNAQTGQTEYKKVASTTIRTVSSVVTIVLADRKSGEIVDTITATEDHPFYVDGKGFVPAGSLAIGNSIVTRAGPPAVVKEVRGHRDSRGITVYNFVVDDNHNYFVGKAGGGVLVHNPDCTELHHLFPQEFAETWNREKIAYHEYTTPIERDFHQNWLHGSRGQYGQGGWWNGTWRRFFAENPLANASEMWAQMQEMRRYWGIDDKPYNIPYPLRYR